MPHLGLSLLGPFAATVDDKPLTPFRTKAVQALIIYLACESGYAHSREHLMTLLWPGLPQKSAQKSLRQTLYLLKRAIPEVQAQTGKETVALLLAGRDSIQVNPEAGFELDVARFELLLAGPLEGWSEALSLYRDDFLADFYLPDSATFEAWTLARREGLRRRALNALEWLAERALEAGQAGAAESYARKQIEIENLRESGHRLLMGALTLSGKRTGALAQYETLRLLLEQELGAAPSEETDALYKTILVEDPIEGIISAKAGLRTGFVRAPSEPDLTDLDSSFPISGPAPPRPVFVGRGNELARLMGFLETTVDGQGQAAFLIGDAGSGKSSLLAAFAEQASQAHEELLVAWGACNAFGGRGDPYLPFRDAISCLTGDVEIAWTGGNLTTEQARTVWQAMPVAIQGIIDHAPDLLSTMAPLGPLITRAEAALPVGHPLLLSLDEYASKPPAAGDLDQPQLFQQVVELFHYLSREQPLLIILDDLQWADSGSVALLFHLGRRLTGGRILILGAYRQDEVTAEAEHPLRRLLDEFRRTYGDVSLDLNQAPGRAFVDAIIDSEANRLDEAFRQTLYQRTAGHPLFTVELLRDMQERGDLVHDDSGAWMAGLELDWQTLPARVEGAIAARIGRLEEELHDILTVAAVEGKNFTLQVVARVQELQERRLLRTLSRELQKRYELVQEDRTERFGRQVINHYRFSHSLFQQFLYRDLSDGERRMYHGEIAVTLEDLYEGGTEEIAVQLARHYIEAGDDECALPYLLQAGDRARTVYASGEAIWHYEKALEILMESSDYERASRILMKLGLAYHNAFDYERSHQAYEESFRVQQQSSLTVAATQLPPAPHALRMTIGDVQSLDPGRHNDQFSITMLGQLFSGLIELRSDMNVVPDVARRWEVLDKGQLYIFHLRDDVRWSDGEPVTAHDFVLGWRRALDPKNGSPAAPNLYDVRGAVAFHQGGADLETLGVKAIDDWTLRIELAQPSSYFLYLMGHNVAWPVPAHVISAHGDDWVDLDHFVSNGPFCLESYDNGRSALLRRTPAYHGHSRGNVEVVKLQVVTDILADVDDLVSDYEEDKYDTVPIGPWPRSQRQRAIQRHAADYVVGPSLWTQGINFDVSRPPFDDPRIRQAFVLATDRQRLAAATTMGRMAPATGGFVPFGMPGHVPGIALPYDLNHARRLLEEAGYPGGKDFPKVSAIFFNLVAGLIEPVLDFWRSGLGVNISSESLDWSAFSRRRGDESDRSHIISLHWLPDYPDPDNVMRLGKAVYSNWDDESYDALVEQARRIMDQDERMRLYRKAEEILVREAPFFPLVYGREHLLVKPWIRNYRPAVIGATAWKDVIIDPH
jgi:ABC-type oligopeptide transport system substrate-binding subunit/DNA-binding SARP family transcriptional activator